MLWGHPVSNCLVSCSSHIFNLFFRHFHLDRLSPHILLLEVHRLTLFSVNFNAGCLKVKGNVGTCYGYKITGLNYFPLPCSLGNSERRVVLACALPSIHGYVLYNVEKIN